jgi:imidazolonepropionase-like amidohydrolase
MPGGVDAHVHLCQDLKTGNSIIFFKKEDCI